MILSLQSASVFKSLLDKVYIKIINQLFWSPTDVCLKGKSRMFIVPWTMNLLVFASLVRRFPWTNRPLVDAPWPICPDPSVYRLSVCWYGLGRTVHCRGEASFTTFWCELFVKICEYPVFSFKVVKFTGRMTRDLYLRFFRESVPPVPWVYNGGHFEFLGTFAEISKVKVDQRCHQQQR